jgi:hypothetical protein
VGLRDLDLSNNSLALPLPGLHHVTRIDLSGNCFSTTLTSLLVPGLWRVPTINDRGGPDVSTEYLNLANTNLSGGLPLAIWQGTGGNLFVGLAELVLADNPNLVGAMPSFGIPGLALIRLDVSGTNLLGEIPDSYGSLFPFAREFHFQNTSLQSPRSALPAFISREDQDMRNAGPGFECPGFWAPLLRASVDMDQSYDGWEGCRCMPKFFGDRDGCQLCADVTAGPGNACECLGKVMKGCFPVGPAGNATLVPCASTSAGVNPCNPLELEIDYQDVSSLCAEGHTGRLCSACVADYFLQGRRCLPCPDQLLTAVASIFQLLGLVLLLAWMWRKASPGVTRDTSKSVNIVVFHAQQLGVLLSSAHLAMPTSLSFFTSTTSAATDFHLGSLLALECSVSLQLNDRLWLAVASPFVVAFLVAALVCVNTHVQRRRARNRWLVERHRMWLRCLRFGLSLLNYGKVLRCV